MTGLNPYPPPERSFDPWNFRADAAVEINGAKLAGYRVEAVDGVVGKVTNCRLEPGDSYLVLTTGRLLGRKVLVPAGTVNHIDHAERRIYIDRGRDQIKHAPAVAGGDYDDPQHRHDVADYYARTLHPSS